MTRCAVCFTVDPIEIRDFAASDVTYLCQNCGSGRAERAWEMRSDRPKKPRPVSVGRVVDRTRVAESSLPPSAMERFYDEHVIAARNMELRADLVDLLEELAS